jgi:hypothetical protein
MRHYFSILALASVSLLLLLAACNDRDDASDDTDIVETAPTEEVAADEGMPEPEPTPIPTPEPVAEYTDEETEQFLLSLEDMPTGWTKSSDSEAGLLDIRLDLVESESMYCSDDPDSYPIDEPTLGASAGFNRDLLGPYLSQSVLLFGSETDASRHMDWFKNEVFGCDSFSDDAVEWRLDEISFPPLGDDSFAVRMSTASELGEIGGDLVLLRVVNVFSLLVYIDIGGFDAEQLEEFALRAEEKLLD